MTNSYNAANQMTWHIPVKIFNFVENMPTLMHASDIMLCKAGGLIVTESLACGLPMILIDVIPGQETGNAEYVMAYGAGDMSETPVTTSRTAQPLDEQRRQPV